MNIDKDLKLLIEPNDKEFKIELPVIVPGHSNLIESFETKEVILVYLLRKLRSFYDLLEKSRGKLGLTRLYKFKEDFSLNDYSMLRRKLGRKSIILTKSVQNIFERYSLSEDEWAISLETVILTNHFPIPYRLPLPIMVNIPKTEKNRWPSLMEDKPSIVFNTRITKTGLIKWIENPEGKLGLKRINNSLPPETTVSSRMKMRTLRVGELAALFKIGKREWINMDKTIDEWDNEDDEIVSSYLGYPPTAEELRLAYRSYIEAIKRLEQGNSES